MEAAVGIEWRATRKVLRAVHSEGAETNRLRMLKAAIGIEPMNKGFAVLKKLFPSMWLSCLAYVFVGHFRLLSIPELC